MSCCLISEAQRDDADHARALRIMRGLETGSGSRFQGKRGRECILRASRRKKTLTRIREANIYNNMLYNIYVSTQEQQPYSILCAR